MILNSAIRVFIDRLICFSARRCVRRRHVIERFLQVWRNPQTRQVDVCQKDDMSDSGHAWRSTQPGGNQLAQIAQVIFSFFEGGFFFWLRKVIRDNYAQRNPIINDAKRLSSSSTSIFISITFSFRYERGSVDPRCKSAAIAFRKH